MLYVDSLSFLLASSISSAILYAYSWRLKRIVFTIGVRSYLAILFSVSSVLVILSFLYPWLKFFVLLFYLGVALLSILGFPLSGVVEAVAYVSGVSFLVGSLMGLVSPLLGDFLFSDTFYLSAVSLSIIVLFFRRRVSRVCLERGDFFFTLSLVLSVLYILSMYPSFVLVKYSPVLEHLSRVNVVHGSVSSLLVASFRAFASEFISDSVFLEEVLALYGLSVLFTAYLLLKRVLGESAGLAILMFSLFSGFGWMYVLKEYGLSELTVESVLTSFRVPLTDIWCGIGPFLWVFFSSFTAGFVLSIVVVYSVLYKWESWLVKVFSVVFYVALFFSCLESAAVVSFLIGLLVLMGGADSRRALILFPGAVGLVAAFYLDMLSGCSELMYLVVGIVLALGAVISLIGERRLDSFIFIFFASLLAVVLLEFTEWIPRAPLAPYESYWNTGAVPFSFYLVVMGVVGLLGPLAILFYLKKAMSMSREGFVVLVSLALSGIAVGRFFSAFSAFVEPLVLVERGAVLYVFLSFAGFSSALIYSIARSLRLFFRGYVSSFSALLVFLLVLMGVASTALSINCWNYLGSKKGYFYTKRDFEGVSALRETTVGLNISSVIVYPSSLSSLLKTVIAVEGVPLAGDLIALCRYPVEFYSLRSCYRTDYLVFSKTGLKQLREKLKWSYLYSYVSREEPLYEDSRWLIYTLDEQPVFSRVSDVVVCFSRRTGLARVIPILDVLLEEGLNCAVFLCEDWSLREARGALILLEDPVKPIELEGRDLVVIINTRWKGFFATRYSEVEPRRVKVAAVLWEGENITLDRPVFIYPMFFPNASVLAWYVDSNGTALGVCACSFVVNETTVYYVDARPLLGARSVLKALLSLLLEECSLGRRAEVSENRWILASRAVFTGDVEACLKGGVFLNIRLSVMRAKKVVLKADRLEIRKGLLNYAVLVVRKPRLIVEDGEVEYEGCLFSGDRVTLLLNKTVVLYSRIPLVKCRGVTIFYGYVNAGFRESVYGVSFKKADYVRLVGDSVVRAAYASSYIFFDVLDYSGVLALPHKLSLGFECFRAVSEFVAFLLVFLILEISGKVFVRKSS